MGARESSILDTGGDFFMAPSTRLGGIPIAENAGISGESGEPLRIGWQEWAALPDLGFSKLKVKIDTGAKTSSLHAWLIEPAGFYYNEDGIAMPLLHVRLDGQPECDDGQTRDMIVPLVRRAWVVDSGGRRERRCVVRTRVQLGPIVKTIELNVTNRQTMRFRMILGRSALENDFIVDVNRTFLLGVPQGAKT